MQSEIGSKKQAEKVSMNNLLLQTESLELIPGDFGQLETAVGLLNQDNNIAILCHPHPLHGGTMYNKVVTTLVKTYQALNISTIRFNFRGVLGSSGTYSEGIGEMDDLLTIINYAKSLNKTKIFLAGFSFGAAIAIKTSLIKKVEHLVAVAPPVLHISLENAHPTCPWIVVQGDLDEVVPAEKVYDFLAARKYQPVILRFPNATHYFHGQLKELQTQLQHSLEDFLQRK